MNNRFENINESISKLTNIEFAHLTEAYTNYMSYGNKSYFDKVCYNLSLIPQDVLFWFMYQ